jgi:DNA-binding transcriptional MerR regulator
LVLAYDEEVPFVFFAGTPAGIGTLGMATNGTATQMVPEDPEEGYYRIGEVSRLTEVKPFVLRYWEGEFPMLEPVKNPAGHRLYRQEDLDLVFKIKRLLYDEGFTTEGARRHLREQAGLDAANGVGPTPAEDTPQILSRKMLLDLRDSLRAFLTLFENR